MSKIDLKNPTVAALRKAGNLAGAATALEVSKGTIGKRLRDLGTTSTLVLAYVAPKAAAPKASKAAPKAPKAATSGERYERITGKVTVLEGPSRFIKVDADHPAVQAMNIVKAEGGSVEAGPSGLKLMDSQGRCFAIAATTKTKAHFYVQRVDQATAEGAAANLGSWSCCWPNRNEGCAVLRDVTKVTKGMVRTLMRLHASNAIDGRTKAARAAAA
jgi:hypothetical protein